MIRGFLMRKLLRRGKPAEQDAPRELADGVDIVPRTLNRETYPPVARPSPSDTGFPFSNPVRDLEEVAREELWEAIQRGARDLVLLTDEWKRRNSDDRHQRVLQLLGVGQDQTGFEPVSRPKKTVPTGPREELPKLKTSFQPPEAVEEIPEPIAGTESASEASPSPHT